MDYLIVAILQIAFSIMKVYDVKWSYENKTVQLTLLSLVMGAVWIISTAIGIGEVIKGNIYMIIVFVICSGIGKVIAIKVFEKVRYRPKVFEKVLKKDKENGK